MAGIEAVKNAIDYTWADPRVAAWVKCCLPLLEFGFTYPPCPVFQLSFNDGLSTVSGQLTPLEFQTKSKIGITGGFEGDRRHLALIGEIRDQPHQNDSFIALFLEPDSYFESLKQRPPLINLVDRVEFWSTSGQVDAVVILPEHADISTLAYYLQIHTLTAPISWCVNEENPYWQEMANYANQPPFNLIYPSRQPILGINFLYSTQSTTAEKLPQLLYEHLYNLCQDATYQIPPEVTPRQQAWQLLSLYLADLS